jgi:Family of unknown function (DUF5681)
MPFAKGQSGNPAGRPVGSRNKFTREMQDGLEENGPLVVQRLLELAGEGNMGAMRQCLDRLMGKHRPSAVVLPAPDSPNYVMDALTEIHRALGAGEIATDEASRLVDFVGRTARVLASKAVEVIDFADRLERCEQAIIALFNAAPAATPEAVIDNNNAETMAASAGDPSATVAAEPAPAPVAKNNEDPLVAAALEKAVQAARPDGAGRRNKVKEQLMTTSREPIATAA